MVGMKPTDRDGKIVPIQAKAARRSGGITDYEMEWESLQRKLDQFGTRACGRIPIPLRDPAALRDIADAMMRFATDVTALHNRTDINEFTRCVELQYLVERTKQEMRKFGVK